MPSYILRAIDPVLWGRVKTHAVTDQVYLRELILALLELYAAGHITVTPTIIASRARPP